MSPLEEEEDRLYYHTLHDFRTSENRAFEQRTQLFLAIDAILVAALAYSPQPPKPLLILLPVVGLAVTFVGIVVGVRITVSLDVLQKRLEEYEGRIWRSGEAPEGGPYTYWAANRKSGWSWVLGCSTRKLVSVWSLAFFVPIWAFLLGYGIWRVW